MCDSGMTDIGVLSTPLLPVSSNITTCTIHRDVEEDTRITLIHCYRVSVLKSSIYSIFCIFTFGILFLLSWWSVRLHIFLRLTPCSPSQSTHLLIRTPYSSELLPTEIKYTYSDQPLLIFYYHHLPYYLKHNQFQPLYLETTLPYRQFIDRYRHGLLNNEEVQYAKKLYGNCCIEVPVLSWSKVFINEVLEPFYVFQVGSVAYWIWDGYWIYAVVIAVLSIISLGITVYEKRKNLRQLRDMAYYETDVVVIRAGVRMKISSRELVPGDVLEIQEEFVMPCDAVILSGGCIVDESMLTGESGPVIKEYIPYHSANAYDVDFDKRYSLYDGTIVKQTRNFNDSKAMGIVVRTGFMTAKGKLVRSILYPRPNKFRFYEDSLKFIIVLAIMSVLGFLVTLPVQLRAGTSIEDMLDNFLNLVTVAVPPSLPVAMTIGTVFSISRLQKKQIYCISPPRVNVAGKVDLVVFDKTGTLTEETMDLIGVRPVNDRGFMELQEDIKSLSSDCKELVECMASCHALTKTKGQLIGHTIDLTIFSATDWEFEEGKFDKYDSPVKFTVKPKGQNDFDIFDEYGNIKSIISLPYEIGVLHTFHFNSRNKRMAVLAKNLQDDSFMLYMKGAPEIVCDLCIEDTLPSDLGLMLGHYTRMGYRVLACAYKRIECIDYTDLRGLAIQDVEQDMQFLGFIILQNNLKHDTVSSLSLLHDADIKSIIASGDAALTSISVARECGIIKQSQDVYLGELDTSELLVWQPFTYDIDGSCNLELEDTPYKHNTPAWTFRQNDEFTLTISGNAFEYLVKRADTSYTDSWLLEQVIDNTSVYARMSPEHKALLIEMLQGRKHIVAMVGDGANDCGALKNADIGVSVGISEASVAAPFTSKDSEVSCIIQILKEGRCALATSLQSFKFMALYSMIQFTSVCMLYYLNSDLSDNQYLSIDLVIILPLAVAICYTEPYHTIVRKQPTASLISVTVLSSVIGQTVIQGGFQFLGYLLIKQQQFYEEEYENAECEEMGFENTVIFLISNFEYIAICIVFSIGKPWKKPAYTNVWLVVMLGILIGLSVYIIISPHEIVGEILNLVELSFEFRVEILCLCMAYCIVAYGYERVVVELISYLVD